MLRSLVGSEMCIRDRYQRRVRGKMPKLCSSRIDGCRNPAGTSARKPAPFAAFTKKAIEKQPDKLAHKKIKSNVCSFYKRGKCRNGERCKFEHVDREEPAPEEAGPAAEVKMVNGVTAQDLTMGMGDGARKGDLVHLKYLGRIVGQKQPFDGTLQGDAPLSFVVGDKSRPAGKVLRGVDIGVVGMRVGGKRKLTIPSTMAYGDAGSNTGVIGNYSTKRRVPGCVDIEMELVLVTISDAPAQPEPETKESGMQQGGEEKDDVDEIEAATGGAQFVKNEAKTVYPKKLNKAALKAQYRQHGFAILENTR
eukprot:TRINITY_DN2241_c0_g1_i2.p1 TRINITY_DN2241_c0_g1~~TRINITY_DN2241_c0_g1_i2.p1  ORF type:complete len:332 (-),score=95.12 TRINITY_DN2241_c0_g1_i2:37-957(-)